MEINRENFDVNFIVKKFEMSLIVDKWVVFFFVIIVVFSFWEIFLFNSGKLLVDMVVFVKRLKKYIVYEM